MRIISGIPVLKRNDGSVQVGLAPHGFIVRGLKKSEQKILEVIGQGREHTVGQLAKIGQASTKRVQKILDALVQCRLLANTPVRGEDEARYYAARGDTRGANSLKDRPILLHGLGRIGAHLAQMLHESGAQLNVHDPRLVTTSLVGTYPLESFALPREEQIRKILGLGKNTRPIQISVGVFCYFPDAYWAKQQRDEGRIALPVTIKPTSVEIGPLLSASRDLCLRCCYLQLKKEDENWDYLAMQLMEYAEIECENTLAWLAAAYIHQQLAWLSAGYECELWNQSVEFSLTSATPLVRNWQHQDECDCKEVNVNEVKTQKHAGVNLMTGRGNVYQLRGDSACVNETDTCQACT